MSQQLPYIIVLMLLICAGIICLMLDGRQKSLDRRIAAAMPTARTANAMSLRRQQVENRWLALHRLVNYRAGISYSVGPQYVSLAGMLVALAVFYGNSMLLEFSPVSVSVVAAIAAVALARGIFGWQLRRLANQLFRQLPDTIEMVRQSVQSGLPVTDAFENIADTMQEPTREQFRIVCDEIRVGKTPDDALEGVYKRFGVTEYGMFAVALGVQMKSGGSLSETLLSIADTVRQRVTLAKRAKALAAEVIFSSRALIAMPFVVGAFLYWINPRMVDMLFTDPTGHIMLAYAVASVILGAVVIRWMVRRETSV
jgi:tight adherence protein B